MKSAEFIIESTNIVPGTILYHGTKAKNLIGIMKYGLIPKRNYWEVSRLPRDMRQSALKESTLALFCTPDINMAKDFGEVVFQFVLLASDKTEGQKFLDNEILILNKISPDRLSVAWPKDFNMDRIERAKEKAQSSFTKTKIIKQLNKITIPVGWKIKSGSKSTSRILTYDLSDDDTDRYVNDSILLEEYPEYLNSKGVNKDIINRVSDIIRNYA